MNLARCQVCGHGFRYDSGTQKAPKPAPEVCGMLACVARRTWGPEAWAGRARMAGARRAAGVELNALDLEALARSQGHHQGAAA